MNPGFHLRHTRAQRLGDLRVRQILIFAQHQRRPEMIRQPRDRLANIANFFFRDQIIQWRC